MSIAENFSMLLVYVEKPKPKWVGHLLGFGSGLYKCERGTHFSLFLIVYMTIPFGFQVHALTSTWKKFCSQGLGVK